MGEEQHHTYTYYWRCNQILVYKKLDKYGSKINPLVTVVCPHQQTILDDFLKDTLNL
jgi:hypothetical protein